MKLPKIAASSEVSLCDQCWLSPEIADRSSRFQRDAKVAVRKLEAAVDIGSIDVLRAEPPDIAEEIAENYDASEVVRPLWLCARQRALGKCATQQITEARVDL